MKMVMAIVKPFKLDDVREALAEVGRCAGTQFDPEVARAFLAVWSRGVLGDLPAAAAF